MQRKRLILGLATALTIASVIWFTQRGGSTATAAAAPPPSVVAAAALAHLYTPQSTYTGSLSAPQSVELKPRVSGTILSVRVPEGQFVGRGQTLFVIDPEPYFARLQAAEAAVREAEARLRIARTEQQRTGALVQEGVLPTARRDQTGATLAERQAQLASAIAARRLAALELSYTNVRAPIAGRVGRVLVTVGNLVAGGDSAPPLTTIESVNPLHVDFSVDERTYLDAIAAARTSGRARTLPVNIRLEDGSVQTARVDYVSNRLDRSTGTIPVRAVVANGDGRLTPGLFAEVEISTGTSRQAVLISDLAVQVEQGRRFVLVLDGQNQLQYGPVQLGGLVEGLRVVTSGLKPGERVLVRGLAGPGMTVKRRLVPMASQGLRASGEGAAK